jgi:hypothetical protein
MKRTSSARLQSSEERAGRRLAVERAIALSKSAGRWQDHREAREHKTPQRDDNQPPAKPDQSER